MTGYEFTRLDVQFDFMAELKAARMMAAYDLNEFARVIVNRAKEDLRKTEDYKDAEHWFIDTTMSCEPEEAIGWMKQYMKSAIAYGITTKALDWRTKFLAAYDIFCDLCKH